MNVQHASIHIVDLARDDDARPTGSLRSRSVPSTPRRRSRRRGLCRLLIVVLVSVVGTVGCVPAAVDIAPRSPAPPSATTSGAADVHSRHVYILILENKTYDDVIGSPAAPYLNSLADQSAVAANYYAVGHPSQPNYLALFAGSTFGVTDNYVHQINAPNLADQLEQAGLTWSVYAENVPTDCFAGEQAADGEDGAGTYARKHNPAISFTSVATNAERCDRIRDFSHFAPLQANVSFIVPNLCHDMHDCAVSVADAWLREFVPRIIDSDEFHRDGVLFITFDEGDGDNNHVATIAVSPFAERGTRSTTRFDHYSLLRTVEQLVGVDCLADSCNATPMTELFQAR